MANFESDPQLPLGKTSPVPTDYDPGLLFLIPRSQGRESLDGLAAGSMYGEDIWTAYELSWLQTTGKPQVAIATFRIPYTSECIIESKSFKLYLNSLYNYRAASWREVADLLENCLSDALNCAVDVELHSVEGSEHYCSKLEGFCLDELDIEIEVSEVDRNLLVAAKGRTEEMLFSHLLRSSCPVTGQPDWASLVINYRGQAIEHSSLLRYIVSYRNHQGFHEQCVERIYADLWASFDLEYLSVYARYLRRGGLDINPFRCSEPESAPLKRLTRQ